MGASGSDTCDLNFDWVLVLGDTIPSTKGGKNNGWVANHLNGLKEPFEIAQMGL